MYIFGRKFITFLIVVLVFVTYGSAQSSPRGDVVGQMAIGYQGWFSTQNDGSPLNVWCVFLRYIIFHCIINTKFRFSH